MKGLKQTSVWEFLNHIQNKTRSNISLINRNKNKIEEYRTLVIDKNIDARELIQRLQSENEELTEENTYLVKLHHKILSLNEELENVKSSTKKSERILVNEDTILPSAEECVKMALENPEIINEFHPCMCDDKIIEMIYNAFIQNERYEECSLIVKIRENRRKHLPSQEITSSF